jgi:hypothetical protein
MSDDARVWQHIDEMLAKAVPDYPHFCHRDEALRRLIHGEVELPPRVDVPKAIARPKDLWREMDQTCCEHSDDFAHQLRGIVRDFLGETF